MYARHPSETERSIVAMITWPHGPQPRGGSTLPSGGSQRAESRGLGEVLAIGIDIGGTKVAAGLVARDGRLIHAVRMRTPRPPAADAVLDAVRDVVATELAHPAAGGGVIGVGVGTAGVVDPSTGVIVSATESLIDWQGVDVAAALGDACRVPVTVDNDVNAIGLAESTVGAARGARRCLIVAVGTGIGGAFIRDGRVDRGASGTAGEVGHLPIGPPDGPRCTCGRRGHLEAYASGPALHRLFLEAAAPVAAADFSEVARLAKARQPIAMATLAQGGAILGRALGGITNLLDPELVVVGGGVISAGPPLMRPLARSFRDELLRGTSSVPLRRARFGARAGVVGAAMLAFEAAAPASATGPRPRLA
jgi:glucokinase